MEEQNSLAFDIRARLLPVIEGADELKAQINQMPQTISTRMSETINSPTFKEGLTSSQFQKVEQLTAGLTGSYEFEKLQARETELIENYRNAIESGKLTKTQVASYNKKFAQLGTDISNFTTEFITGELGDKYFGDIDPARKEMLRASAKQGAEEAYGKMPDITQKLSQINYANDYIRKIGEIERENLQRRKNLEYDVEDNSFTKARGQRYLKGERESIRKMEEMAQEAKEKFGGTEFGERIYRTIADDIEVAKSRMKDFGDEIEKAGKGSENILRNMKASGLLTAAGIAVDAGLRYALKTEQIEATERTSFDFSSPLAMYNARERYQLAKDTIERTRDYELAGGLIGAGAGVLGGAFMGAKVGSVAGPWGTLAGIVVGGISGYMTGSSLGAQKAELTNIEKRAEVEEELKFFNESYGTLSGYVTGPGRGYDIERARTRARLGNYAVGNLGYGYGQTEELAMRNTFADQYGRWDEKLYTEQTTFARAKGIDPNELYKLDVTARQTGMDVGISGMEEARKIATNLYGSNASSQRIVDVLNDLKKINERMLDVNINMDTREAAQIGMLPSLIFGTDTPYGRIGDPGYQKGLNAIESLGRPGSLAEDAWLYNAYGSGDLNKFAERKKLGIIGSLENFNAIAAQMNRDYDGNEFMIERRLHTTKDDSIPTAGLIPLIAKMIAEHPQGFTQEDFEKLKNDPKFKAQTLDDYKKMAEGATPESLRREESISKLQIDAAEKWRKTVYDMAEASSKFWKEMGDSAEYHKMFMDKMTGTIGDMDAIAKRIMQNLGIVEKPKAENPFKDEEDMNKFYHNKQREAFLKKAGLLKPEEAVKDIHGKEATGFVKQNFSELRKELSESTLGARYRVNLLEGDANIGHAPGSPHYTGKAFDVSLYDKFASKRITADSYPKEVRDFFHEFAKDNGLTYGGNFKRTWRDGKFVAGPDNNHFQEGKGLPSNAEIDYDKIGRAVADSLRGVGLHVNVTVKDEHDHLKDVSTNANSVFTGGR